MSGPPKQPKAIAIQKKTFQPCRYPDDIGDSMKLSFVYNNLPTPPDGMDKDAKKIWTKVLGEASRLYGYISFIDLLIFENYCNVSSEVIRLSKLVDEEGFTIVNEKGNPSQNPNYVALKEARKEMLQIGKEFGFTPSARSRVRLEQQKEEQKQDEFKL